MMRKIRELLKNKAMLNDFFNLFLGIVMMVALFLYGTTKSTGSMYLVIFSGGAMNLSGGYQLYQKKTRKNTGISMMMLGTIILILGFITILQ